MFYTVYKITNIIDNKFYIGMHQTENPNDSYMGSGTLLKRAIQKYGIENFKKEILHVFNNETEMRDKEKELVVLHEINEMSYNLCEGGKGGFGYLNRSGKALRTGMKHSEESRKKMGTPNNTFSKGYKFTDEQKKNLSVAMSKALKGKRLSEEHKKKISEAIKRLNEKKKAGLV